MADPNASIWKQILEKLETTNRLLAAQLPEQDISKLLQAPKRFDTQSIEQQLNIRSDTFSSRLQRFKEGMGYSVSEDSVIGGASSTPAAGQWKKLRINNPENSPVVIIITEAHLSISAINTWVIENPLAPAAAASGTKIQGQNKKAGLTGPVAITDYITSATDPARPFFLSGRASADVFLEIPLGTILPPNSSEFIDLRFGAGTENWTLGAEWFEVPLI